MCRLAASIERTDIVPNFDAVRRESVHTIFSTISFGLSCRVALGSDETQRGRRLSSLISLDPYPHHILASLQLAADILLIYLERGEIAQDAFDSFCRIAFDALDELPQYLQSVQRVRKLLRDSLNAGSLSIDTSLDSLREPTGGFPSTLRGQRHQQINRNEHQNGDEYILDEETYGGITGSDQLLSFVAKIDEAGHGCQANSLFARPSITLSTNS